jgi:glycosyltransferase involved in cell wall biosynthesis
VLLLSASYPPVLGGLQTAVHALARNLLARGHAVRVVTNRYPRSLPAGETIDGVPVERWPFVVPSWWDLRRGRPDLFAAGLYCLPAVRGRLRRLIGSFRPDVVNIHFPDGQIPFLLPLCRRRGFRLVASLHGDEVMRYTGEDGGGPAPGREARGLCALLREADAVTACSGRLLDLAARLEPSVAAKGTAVYNGIDPERFRDKTPYAHPRPYVLAFGRLTYKKGFDLLLEALARVGPAADRADLLLAGDGEERPALEALARRLGLGGRVHFLGRASPERIVRLLNGCLFLAVPSRAEPFGIVALEGLAAGRPVLATRVGGMGPFLEQFLAWGGALAPGAFAASQQSVVLAKPDAAALAEGLRTCLGANGSAPDGQAVASTVLREFSWARAAQTYEEILSAECLLH